METFLADLMQWIQAHPAWAGLIVLVVSALESFLVVGLFVPGTVVMFGIGAMIAAGSMELVPTLIMAALGAVLGDGLSYLIGRHYHQRLRVMWPFRSHPAMIARSMEFFHRHGGKSIIFARFVGPVRPLLPGVVGMLDMPPARFFLFNILSALLWAPAYILPGVLFGASLGVATEIAGRLGLLLVILLAIVWSSWWLVKRIARSLQPHALSLRTAILDGSRRHRYLHPLAAALLDPDHPEARGMTVLTTLLFIASFLFLITPRHLPSGGLPGNLDLYVFNNLQALRSPFGDQLLIVAGQIGSGWVLYSFTALMSLWLLWRRRWRATLHWLVTVASVGLLTHAIKAYTAIDRPPLPGIASLGHAFPSAEASVSVAVFGFLAVVIARELRSNWHWIAYSTAVFLIVITGFAPLYLGAHWLTDILGGWSLGLAWVALMGIAYRQHPAPPISAGVLAPVALTVLALITGIYSSQHRHEALALYRTPAPEPVLLSRADWLSGGWRSLPAYRDDLKGGHHHPLDVQWMGSADDLRDYLTGKGWRTANVAGMTRLFDLFNSDAGLQDLPVLPQVHQGQTEQLLLVRNLEVSPPRLMALRLWKSRPAPDTRSTLWVGNVSYLYIEDRLKLLRFLRTDADFDTPLHRLAADTAELAQRRVQRSRTPPPEAGVQWDGGVLLLYP